MNHILLDNEAQKISSELCPWAEEAPLDDLILDGCHLGNLARAQEDFVVDEDAVGHLGPPDAGENEVIRGQSDVSSVLEVKSGEMCVDFWFAVGKEDNRGKGGDLGPGCQFNR